MICLTPGVFLEVLKGIPKSSIKGERSYDKVYPIELDVGGSMGNNGLPDA